MSAKRIGDEVDVSVDVVVATIELLSGDEHSATFNVNGKPYSLSRFDVLTVTRPVKAKAVIRSIEGQEQS